MIIRVKEKQQADETANEKIRNLLFLAFDLMTAEKEKLCYDDPESPLIDLYQSAAFEIDTIIESI